MKNILLLILLFAGYNVSAQISEPVKWTYTAKKVSDKVYDIYVTAMLDNTWHIYAQEAGEGPEPTSFTFSNNPIVKLEGKVKEIGKLEKEFDPNFGSVLKFYSNKVDFVQRVKLKTAANTILKGSVTFMVCNDKKCLPPRQVPFTVNLSGK